MIIQWEGYLKNSSKNVKMTELISQTSKISLDKDVKSFNNFHIFIISFRSSKKLKESKIDKMDP
jgi:hypothetical protein